MKNNKIFIIYVFLLILFVSILKNINCICIDIPFLTNEMIYFYQFILHIFLILPKYGYFQEKITHNYLHYVIRCRSKVSLYHLLIKECLQFVFVITMIKIIVEGIAFHYFNFYISLIYGFVVLLFSCFVDWLLCWRSLQTTRPQNNPTTKPQNNPTTTYRFIIFLPFTI